jgi:hypothetical protein
MTESTASEQVVHQWYTWPVLFVSDVQSALRFYVENIGFKKKWHVENARQIDRDECEIILCEDPSRQHKSRLFLELNRDGIDQLRREISERSVPTEKTWWGYDTIRILDLDSYELLFPLDETNDPERQSITTARPTP